MPHRLEPLLNPQSELHGVRKELEVQEKFRSLGLDMIGSKPDQFSTFPKKDIVQ